jgi:translation initiation factor 3 subunit C
MSSRFFHGGDSDSESSSSDEEELYNDREDASEEESEEEGEDEDDSDEDSSSEDEGKGTGAARFLKPSGGMGADDSDESDEEEDRIVKSAKDKRLDELQQTITAIRNAEKINDWAVISTGTTCQVLLWLWVLIWWQNSTR